MYDCAKAHIIASILLVYCRPVSGVTVSPSRGDTKMWLNFRKNTAGQTRSEGGSCDEMTAKKGHHFAYGDD